MADRAKLDEYIAELEAAAYARGVEDGRAQMRSVVEEMHAMVRERVSDLKADVEKLQGRLSSELTEKVTEFVDAEVRRRTAASTEAFREPREGSDEAKVLEVIRAEPGGRGVDVVNKLAPAVEERTVRTSLHRLKKKGAIFQEEGKWFAKSIEGQTPGGA